MTLFSSLRARSSLSSPDEKDHNSDGDSAEGGEAASSSISAATTSAASPSHNQQRAPLISLSPGNGNDDDDDDDDDDSSSFPLRIKLNDGKSTVDLVLDNVPPNASVRKLKERILNKHFSDDRGDAAGTTGLGSNNNGSNINSNAPNNNNNNNNNRYLRLIVRGRMMAPDTSALESFSIVADDVVHAVLAKEGVRGGQQARMLRRLNHHANTTNRGGSSSSSGGGNDNISSARGARGGGAASLTSGGGIELLPLLPVPTSSGRSREARDQSLWRRIGIDANGVVVSSNNNNNDEDTDEDDDDDDDSGTESSDFEDARGEIDLEAGRHHRPERVAGGRRRRRRSGRRERRGFDRLRATGMTRDEVTALRLYFARPVDRYIERRRVMIRASRRLRASLNDIASNLGTADNSVVTASSGGGSNNRGRTGTGESSNSLLEEGDEESNNNNNDNNAAGGSNDAADTGNTEEGGNATGVNDNANVTANNNSNAQNNTNDASEGEEILLDRLRMEDEWMSTQGPYSEFRMNLDTSNPLLLAAITGGNTPAATTHRRGENQMAGPAGLFFRSRGGGGIEDEEDVEDPFGGAFTPNGTFVRNPNGANNPNAFHPYMGPVPSAGTDKDFVWGFILGFFVGFIMLFWVWMPTVPHKQKIGIISGISFQLGLGLLKKGGEGGPGHVSGGVIGEG